MNSLARPTLGSDSVVGNWIKQRRKSLDLTQVELGRQVGCSSEYIRKIEQGTRRPSKEIALLLSVALGLMPEHRERFIVAVRSPLDDQMLRLVLSGIEQMANHRTSRLVGRSHELAQIDTLLANADCRLLTLFGMGGVGKTALALAAADECAASFRDGVVIVQLAEIPSVASLPGAIARSLGVPVHGPIDPLTEVIRCLKDKHALLILDTFEHLLTGAAMLNRLLAAAPFIKIMVTSREALKTADEWVIDLHGLGYPAERDLVSETQPAVELFCGSASRVIPSFTLREQAAAVGAICRHVRGLPLAIEMAASWLRYMPCAEIARQMALARLDLTSTNRDVSARHRSMRLVFEQSWQLLSAPERTDLIRLSILAQPFNARTALEAAHVPYAALLVLVDKALLSLTDRSNFELHPLIQRYARPQIVRDPATQIAPGWPMDPHLTESLQTAVFEDMAYGLP